MYPSYSILGKTLQTVTHGFHNVEQAPGGCAQLDPVIAGHDELHGGIEDPELR